MDNKTVYLSVPCVGDRTGVASVLRLDLDGDEAEGLRKSAEVLKGVRRQVDD